MALRLILRLVGMILVHEFLHNLAIVIDYCKPAYLTESKEHLTAPQIAWKT